MKIKLLVLILSLFLFSCGKNQQSQNDVSSNNNQNSKSQEDSLKKRELELKQKELELKEKELNLKEKDKSTDKLRNINITGKWIGTIKDGTKWEVYFTSQYLKEFDGYSTIYWSNHPEGFVTRFAGTVENDNSKIIIYEDRNAKGSGKFEGTISSDGNSMTGIWHRYSDNGSFTWNLSR